MSFALERRIGCFKIGAFEIELARINDRRLRNWPTALVAQNSAAATLLDLSSEAREEGVHDGMKLWQARQVCPSLRIVLSDAARLSNGQKLVQQTLAQASPVCEQAHPGEFYFDLTGAARFNQDPITAAAHIANQLSDWGLHGATGVATNKLVSNVATRCFEPKSIYEVRPGDEQSFLSPLPVNWLPGIRRLFGAGWNQASSKMEELRLHFNRDLVAVRNDHLEIILGRRARVLKQWSTGLDPAPIWDDCSNDTVEFFHTLDKDENDDDILLNILFRLLERLCSGLRQQNRWLREIKLYLQYTDGRETLKRHRLNAPSQIESSIYPAIEKAFFSVMRRVRIRRVGLTGVPVRVPIQFDLFDSARNRDVPPANDYGS